MHPLDRDLSRYVLRDERVVVAVRQHWMAHYKPFGVSLLALALALWTDVKAPPTQAGASASQLLWFLWLVSLGWVAWTVLNWRRDWFVATDKRFLMFYGFITRKVAMMPLAKVTDLTFNRTIMGRVLGYGDFTLESAGQHQALSHIDYIPEADLHYREICAVLFGESDDDLVDDEDLGDIDGTDGNGGGFGGGFGGDPGDGFGDGGHGGGGPAYPASHPSGPGAGAREFTTDSDAYAVSDARAFGVPVQPSRRPGRHRPPGAEGDRAQEFGHQPRVEYLYRSGETSPDPRLDDTSEIPVVTARPLPSSQVRRRPPRVRQRPREERTDELLYPPKDWMD